MGKLGVLKAVKDGRGRDLRWRTGGRAADAGWTLSGSILGCLFLGYLIGEYWDANPAAMVTGLFVGVVVGFYNLAKIMWATETEGRGNRERLQRENNGKTTEKDGKR